MVGLLGVGACNRYPERGFLQFLTPIALFQLQVVGGGLTRLSARAKIRLPREKGGGAAVWFRNAGYLVSEPNLLYK